MNKNIIALIIAGINIFGIKENSKAQTNKNSDMQTFFVGTYTDGESEGIYRYGMHTKSGKLQRIGLAAKSENPSYIALSNDQNFLVTICEVMDKDNNNMGYVESFAISEAQEKLTFINRVASGGAHPCYVSVDDEGFVLSANYTGGNVGLFMLNKNGRLSEFLDVRQHTGKGTDTKRQKSPHAHSAYFEPNGKRVFAVDLGINAVKVYELNSKDKKLIPASTPEIQITPQGVGPRHLAFHPKKKYLYVINEMGCTISVIKMKNDGSFEIIESVSTQPADYKKPNTCADIHISNDGKFLYGSNRGHNSIAIFSINQNSGRLTLIEHEPTRGEMPRNFTLSPDNNFILAANQNTNNIVSFRRNTKTGKLTFVDEIKAPKPVCLLFRY